MKRIQLPLVISALLCGSLLACGPDNYDNDGFGDDADNDDTDVDEFLNDGEIAQIMISANQGEIDLATAAQGRVQSPVASAYAENMVTAHVQLGERFETILAESSIEPEVSEVSNDIDANVGFLRRQLTNAAPSNVDRVFLEGQAQFHLDVANLIEDELIAAANDNDLRGFLETLLEHISEHHAAAVSALGELDVAVE